MKLVTCWHDPWSTVAGWSVVAVRRHSCRKSRSSGPAWEGVSWAAGPRGRASGVCRPLLTLLRPCTEPLPRPSRWPLLLATRPRGWSPSPGKETGLRPHPVEPSVATLCPAGAGALVLPLLHQQPLLNNLGNVCINCSQPFVFSRLFLR